MQGMGACRIGMQMAAMRICRRLDRTAGRRGVRSRSRGCATHFGTEITRHHWQNGCDDVRVTADAGGASFETPATACHDGLVPASPNRPKNRIPSAGETKL